MIRLNFGIALRMLRKIHPLRAFTPIAPKRQHNHTKVTLMTPFVLQFQTLKTSLKVKIIPYTSINSVLLFTVHTKMKKFYLLEEMKKLMQSILGTIRSKN